MTTNFTLRDFFVFLLTGLTLVVSVCILFYDEIFDKLTLVCNQYPFIKDISFVLTILIIPTIYLLGHLIGTLSYLCLKLYTYIYRLLKNGKDIPKWRYDILMFFQMILYRQRSVYAIIKYIRKYKIEKCYFKDVEEFWTICALLQIENNYSPAEYWNLLNEFFNSINLVFLISAIIAFSTGHWLMGLFIL